MVELYRLTQFRKKQLQAFYPDFETVEIWEHECKDLWKTLDPEIKEKKKKKKKTAHPEPLDLR